LTSRDQPDRSLWAGVEVRHLAALAAIAHEGSFRAAAARLGYAQSAVSQHISFLERLVGLELIERSRGPRPMRFTDAGEALLGHAESILAGLAAARADLVSMGSGTHHPAQIGAEPSVVRKLMPAVLSELAVLRPSLQAMPVEMPDAAERIALVEGGDLDAAFVDSPARGTRLETLDLAADPHVLIVPAGDPLARLPRAPRLEEIFARTLLGASVSRLAGMDTPRGLAAERAAAELLPDAAVQPLVAARRGAAVLPRLAVEDDPRIAVVDLGGAVPPRIIALAWHRDRRFGDHMAALREAAVRAVPKVAGLMPLRDQAGERP
jgi:DNA-binding transcriptional LysR family regulator